MLGSYPGCARGMEKARANGCCIFSPAEAGKIKENKHNIVSYFIMHSPVICTYYMEKYLLCKGFYTLSAVPTDAGPQAVISLQKCTATEKKPPLAAFTLFIPTLTERRKMTATVGHFYA